MSESVWIVLGAVGILGAALAMVLVGVSRAAEKRRTLARVFATDITPDEIELTQRDAVDLASRRSGPLARPWRWVPWALAAASGLVAWLAAGWTLTFAGSSALIAGLMGSQLEAFLAQRRAARIETQLADAVDLMVGALGAGSGALQAIEAALAETAAPLQGELADILGRIRFGDDPQSVFRQLGQRVPLETFVLFSSALAVHWEVGGSLAPVLATLGRTLRDRIELGRRIRANIAQSQVSTVAVLGLTYFIALVVWRNAPGPMERFVTSPLGSAAVATTMVLQAVGIVWMNAMSRPRF